MARRRPRLHLVVFALLAACGRPDATSDAFLVVDSSGVDLAESSAPAWASGRLPRWSITATPELDLTETGDGPASEFYRVRDATIRSDGSIVVANAGSSEVRLYSGAGEALGAVGRDGDGPGEYRQISRLIRLPGDSVGVFSWPTRLTVLAPDLSFVRTLYSGRPSALAGDAAVRGSGGSGDLPIRGRVRRRQSDDPGTGGCSEARSRRRATRYRLGGCRLRGVHVLLG